VPTDAAVAQSYSTIQSTEPMQDEAYHPCAVERVQSASVAQVVDIRSYKTSRAAPRTDPYAHSMRLSKREGA
jgi:hypothetical protein